MTDNAQNQPQAHDEPFFTEDDIIHSYTRADALEDGNLVDVSQWCGGMFTVQTVVTRSVWEDCIEWSKEDTERTGMGQDTRGRAHDVLWLAFLTARSKRGSSDQRREFDVYRIPRHHKKGQRIGAQRVRLAVVVGPGDHMEPVINIMQANED